MKIKLHKLNSIGVAHLLLPLMIVVGAGIIGSFVAVKSMTHADPNPNPVSAYTGNNDGCGNNATHYDKSKLLHVGRKKHGKDSVCVCNNGNTVAYKAVKGNNTNKKCSAGANASSNNSKQVSYNDGDGCGGNATHYYKGNHVGGSTKKGTCKCNNGNSVKYKKYIPNSKTNKACNKANGGSTAKAKECSGNAWYTSGKGGKKTYKGCLNGKYITKYCRGGMVTVSSKSNNGPCKMKKQVTPKTQNTTSVQPDCVRSRKCN